MPEIRPPSAAYAEVKVDFHACPLVRLSRGWAGARLECSGPAAPVHCVAKERVPRALPPEAEAERAEVRYEGDGFRVLALRDPDCSGCFYPYLRERGFPPLKAVAVEGELHVATAVEDLPAFRRLLADLRAGGMRPKVSLLAHETGHRSGILSRDAALDGLTPRQAEVLEDAYRAGYFHGRELDVERHAEVLGVGVSTYYGHLRTATRKVLQHVLAKRLGNA